MNQDYSSHYNESDFWGKVKKHAKKAGAKVLQPAFELYYAFKAEETPTWAKGVAIAALGYFILPFDAIPDIIPGGGFIDDIATMGVAITSIGRYVTDDIRKKAAESAAKFIG
jgi:uncharacterized membrane protein YkvA (DUF1232 family)